MNTYPHPDMAEYLSAKQVQEVLQVDRTTVYRMLQDGRLDGTKIGRQWRFDRNTVETLLKGERAGDGAGARSSGIMPLHCIKPIQDVFAEVAQVGAVTTDAAGAPITEISNACAFCALILASESGQRACQASWAKLARQPEQRPAFVNCHAGLQYARARIEPTDREPIAMLIAGQFYARDPDPAEEAARIRELAYQHGIDESALAAAAQLLPVLDDRMRSQIGSWLEKVAHTFEEISRERADFMSRFRVIAEMSSL